ncbi:hypothetical protein HGRIS_006085 [Hohenbuehelia grisea]|uniref:N-terminal Ras-GEF domain-containing protein n=1 Tax=Hohenbuehelia grisea TaxID=104357 RepID=A0ABR3JZX9_9AGAR
MTSTSRSPSNYIQPRMDDAHRPPESLYCSSSAASSPDIASCSSTFSSFPVNRSSSGSWTRCSLDPSPFAVLEHAFPEGLLSADKIRLVARQGNAAKTRCLAIIFVSRITSIIATVDHCLPAAALTAEFYQSPRNGVLFTTGLFSIKLMSIDSSSLSKADVDDSIENAITLMEMTAAAVRELITRLTKFVQMGMPLATRPSIQPSSITERELEGFIANLGVLLEAAGIEEPLITATLAAEPVSKPCAPPNSPSSSTSTSSPTSSTDTLVGAPETPPTQTTVFPAIHSPPKPFSNKSPIALFRDIFHVVAATVSKTSLNPSDTADAPAAFDKSYKQFHPLSDMPYELHLSAIYFPESGLSAEVTDMPLPEGPSAAVRLSPDKDLKGISLPALVRILTSPERTKMRDDFVQTVFTCFRFFATPLELFSHFASRFEEQPSPGLPACKMEAWSRHMKRVRSETLRILVVWMTEYWQHEFDAPILPRVLNFARKKVLSRKSRGVLIARSGLLNPGR